jgi:hypothetical protein
MPFSATRARSGKGGRILWGGTISANPPFSPPGDGLVLLMQEWSLTERADDLDSTGFEDQGTETGLTGVGVVEFTFRGLWDAGQNMLIDPPGIWPRPDGGPCVLYENLVDGVFWAFPCVRILSAQQTNPVRGLVTFSASCKSNGIWQRPNSNVAGPGYPLGNLVVSP